MSPIYVPGKVVFDNGQAPAAIAGVAPTLDYRFARDKREIETVSLTDKLTFTGGNQGTFVGSDEFVQQAITNVPRFNHNPTTKESLGLLVEEARTNSIRNNTMVGAVAGTPGTGPANWALGATTDLTRTIVGIGIENGINYIDIRYTGTVTAARAQYVFFDTSNVIAAASGQSWTGSAWLKIAAGSLSNISSVVLQSDTRDSSIVYVNTPYAVNVTPTTTFTRFSGTGTAAATTAFIQPFIVLTTATSGLVDITLRIGLPQLEQGAFATSVIPTTSAAVTRAADVASINGTGVITGTYTMVEKPAGCAVVSGSNINLQTGFTTQRVMVFPAALSAGQITSIRSAM